MFSRRINLAGTASVLLILGTLASTSAAPAQETRDDWQRVPAVFEALGAQPGARIADVGAGGGFFTVRLSRSVGAEGRVFAVDIVENTLRRLAATLRDRDIGNVELILGDPDDPHLPYASLDGALIVNAYHEMVEYPEMLANIRESLREGGRLVIVDNRPSENTRDRASQTAGHDIALRFAEEDLRAAGFDVVRREPLFIDLDHGGHQHRHWMLVGVRPERDPAVQRLAGAPAGPEGRFSCAFPGTRQELLDRASPPDSADVRLEGGARVKLCYSRPSARGRTIMGVLVPFAEPWRTGANEAVLLRTDAPFRIGNVAVPAGWHSIYTIPGPERWTVAVNALVNRQGIPIDAWVRESDLGTFTVLAERTDGFVETMTMGLWATESGAGELTLEWEWTRVRIPFEVVASPGPVSASRAPDQEDAQTRRLVEAYERPSRLQALQIPRVLGTLGLGPGMSVADIGAGSGLFTRPLARAVGVEGVVWAVEIAPGMLAHIRATAEREGIDNIRTVLGEEDDPKLPEAVDLVLMADMLHQVREKEAYLATLRFYLTDGGRVAVVDLVNNWPTRPEMSYTAADLDGMMERLGYRKLASYDFVEGHFFAVYE